mmetsp:Transcript_18/g.72  ORF Transcript_18/g.72 Transcript_18/m.72 type:complete len:277 (+) Transcript_18:12-842(+)
MNATLSFQCLRLSPSGITSISSSASALELPLPGGRGRGNAPGARVAAGAPGPLLGRRGLPAADGCPISRGRPRGPPSAADGPGTYCCHRARSRCEVLVPGARLQKPRRLGPRACLGSVPRQPRRAPKPASEGQGDCHSPRNVRLGFLRRGAVPGRGGQPVDCEGRRGRRPPRIRRILHLGGPRSRPHPRQAAGWRDAGEVPSRRWWCVFRRVEGVLQTRLGSLHLPKRIGVLGGLVRQREGRLRHVQVRQRRGLYRGVEEGKPVGSGDPGVQVGEV